MTVVRRLTVGLGAMALAAWAAGGAWAQGQRQVRQDQYQIPFNFSSPGARSLALGGAFAALADDATAAYANPAGLANLSRPEVSVEGRSWSYSHVFPARGRSFGAATGLGDDTIDGVVGGEASDRVNGVSFLSFVQPFRRGALAVYRHELSNFAAHVESRGVFLDGIESRPGGPGEPPVLSVEPFRLFPTRSAADLDLVSYGVGGSWRLTDTVSLGLTLALHDLSFASRTRRFDTAGLYGPPDFGREVSRVEVRGDDRALGVTAGCLWQVTPALSLGAVYRQGVALETSVQDFVVSPGGLLLSSSARDEFRIPSVIVAGAAFKATEPLTLSVEVDRVAYSQLTLSAGPQVRADDAYEFHFGLEYVVLKTRQPVSLRTGAWFDPDHRPSFRGRLDETALARALATRFPRGDDAWHYAGGIGIVLGESFQLDAAVDLSPETDTLSLSSVVRF